LRGTREPSDIAYYPRSNKVYFRGVGLMARIERLDYWDGEADRPVCSTRWQTRPPRRRPPSRL
jgi:hypothetical protein